MKINNLEFYYIKQEYIEYIRQFDKKVPMKNRPYLGIVLKNENYIYLAPLYSAREKHKNYFMNNTFFRIYDYYNNYIGLIRFSNMIPVPKTFIQKIKFDYSNKLYQEYFYISKHQHQILKKAKYTYTNYDKVKNICVDFKMLEDLLKNRNKDKYYKRVPNF